MEPLAITNMRFPIRRDFRTSELWGSDRSVHQVVLRGGRGEQQCVPVKKSWPKTWGVAVRSKRWARATEYTLLRVRASDPDKDIDEAVSEKRQIENGDAVGVQVRGPLGSRRGVPDRRREMSYGAFVHRHGGGSGESFLHICRPWRGGRLGEEGPRRRRDMRV